MEITRKYPAYRKGKFMNTALHMQNTLRVQTTVEKGGKIELSAPQLHEGETVEVIILLPHTAMPVERQYSALDILDNTSGHRIFQTAEDVEQYLTEERDAWER